MNLIDIYTTENPHISGNNLSKKIVNALGLSLSSTTINNIRKPLHYSFKHPRKRPQLSERHIENRIDFCAKGLFDDDGPLWDVNVVFSDESRFCLHDDSRRLWIKRGVYTESTFKNVAKYLKGIMIWACIALGWRSPLVFVEGRLDSE